MLSSQERDSRSFRQKRNKGALNTEFEATEIELALLVARDIGEIVVFEASM